MSLLRPIESGAKLLASQAIWFGSRLAATLSNPAAVEFCDALTDKEFRFDDLVHVAPTLRVIYVAVPKVASTRIKQTLAEAVGRRSLAPHRRERLRGLHGPQSMTVSAFHRLATDPDTLRFSFVRNPYARLLSCWADKWKDKPLARGDVYAERYLAQRREIDPALPEGPDKSLSFAEFVTYATAIAHANHDAHIQAQHDILAVPGMSLDFVGRIERFTDDIVRVLDHIGANCALREKTQSPLNPSRHGPWQNYYTPELRERIYRAYEQDFDRFHYPRTL